MTRKLNLGCGEDVREGWVNLDIINRDGVDVVHDLEEYPYPFDDNTFSRVYASHVLEHINDPVRAMQEIHRICEAGAEIEIWTPHFTSSDAYADLTHAFPGFSCRFMDYFSAADTYVPDYGLKGLFEVKQLKLRFNKRSYPWNLLIQPIANLAPRWWENSPLRVFPANDIHAILKVVKP